MGMHESLAEDVLGLLGINAPSKDQVSIMKTIVDSMVVRLPVSFDHRLTGQERICLFWSAKGKSSVELATILNIKKVTVDGYKKRIMRKLACQNMTQAVFEGLKLGEIISHF